MVDVIAKPYTLSLFLLVSPSLFYLSLSPSLSLSFPGYHTHLIVN